MSQSNTSCEVSKLMSDGWAYAETQEVSTRYNDRSISLKQRMLRNDYIVKVLTEDRAKPMHKRKYKFTTERLEEELKFFTQSTENILLELLGMRE